MAVKICHNRREFFFKGTVTGSGLLLAGLSGITVASEKAGEEAEKDAAETEEGISPAEDLMREHGVLNRILLIYDESLRRLNKKEDVPPKTLASAAKIIRTFIEDYHEKLEEDHLFPLFEKAGKLVDLVKVLREQHQAGRKLTDQIQQISTSADSLNEENSRQIGRALRQFVRMYRPHEAREDTVLFPVIRTLVTPKQYDDLGEQFEEQEHKLFGEHGFVNTVEKVADFEKTLGIYELSQFTPRP